MKETGPNLLHWLFLSWAALPIAIHRDEPEFRWAVRWRCVDCGVATPISRFVHRDDPAAVNAKADGGNDRWFCTCGATSDRLIRWVGRQTWWGWEWRAEADLPPDLHPKPPPAPANPAKPLGEHATALIEGLDKLDDAVLHTLRAMLEIEADSRKARTSTSPMVSPTGHLLTCSNGVGPLSDCVYCRSRVSTGTTVYGAKI